MKQNSEEKHFLPSDMDLLREKIKPYVKETRLPHVYAVEEEAAYLGEKMGFSEHDILRLRAAALLHDITKKADVKKQLKYAEEFGIIFSTSQILAPEVMHAVTGSAFSKKYFSDFVDDDILSAVSRHTTGCCGMTLFEAIIYLSDITEKTRTYKDCVKLRNRLHSGLEAESDPVLKKKIFYDSMIQSFDTTIKHLISKGAAIDIDTIAARNYFIENRVGMEASAEADA